MYIVYHISYHISTNDLVGVLKHASYSTIFGLMIMIMMTTMMMMAMMMMMMMMMMMLKDEYVWDELRYVCYIYIYTHKEI